MLLLQPLFAGAANFVGENNGLRNFADRFTLLPALLLQGKVSALLIEVQFSLQNTLSPGP